MRSRTMPRAFVPTAGGMKLRMRMRDELHAKRRLLGKVTHDTRRLIGRAIVGHDDFDLPAGPLHGNGFQHSAHVPRHLIGGHDDRQFGRTHRRSFSENQAAWKSVEPPRGYNSAATMPRAGDST